MRWRDERLRRGRELALQLVALQRAEALQVGEQRQHLLVFRRRLGAARGATTITGGGSAAGAVAWRRRARGGGAGVGDGGSGGSTGSIGGDSIIGVGSGVA